MNSFLIIDVILIAFLQVNSQTLQYACRFRNFTIESETGSAYLVDIKIYQDKNEHRLEGTANITKDIHAKSMDVVVHRCRFEKYDCEYFQRWKFDRKLKDIYYMRNQIWSPITDSITPKMDFPVIKKNIYHSKGATIDTNAALKLYPEAVNYFWRVDAMLNDYNDRKSLIMKFDLSIFSYVERKTTRNRGTNLKPA